jgi:Tol biopolymer transport system component
MWFLPVSGGRPQGAPEFVKGGIEQITPLGFTRNGSFYYAQGLLMDDIYVVKMDPKSGRILAPPEKLIMRFEGTSVWPAYSPDGKSLAYTTARTRMVRRAPNILRIRSLETGQEREFTTEFSALSETRWSPDGRSLYLHTLDKKGWGIYQVDAQTGKFTPIVRPGGPFAIFAHEISFTEQAGRPLHTSMPSKASCVWIAGLASATRRGR